MSKKDAQLKFLETAEPILDLTGNKDLIEHPDRERIDKKYDECVEIAVANGANRQKLEQDYLIQTAEPGSIEFSKPKVDVEQIKSDLV